jgi:hypothetical protein
MSCWIRRDPSDETGPIAIVDGTRRDMAAAVISCGARVAASEAFLIVRRE